MNLGIVILNYNDAGTVLKLHEKIKDYRVIRHIIIVDNFSTDNSYDVLRSLEKGKTVVLRSNKNGGYAYGNNIGVKWLINNTDTDIICIANPDIVVDETVFKRLLNGFIETDFAALSGFMQNRDGSIRRDKFCIPSYWWDLSNYTLFYRQLFRLFVKKYSQKLEPDTGIQEVEMLPGSFFLIRKEVFQEIGLFDENTFLFCEERILGNKLKTIHKKMGIDTGVVFLHMHSISIRKTISIYNEWKRLNESRLYYNIEYNKINKMQETILRLAMQLFMLRLKRKLKV